jgi:surface polysaccharide O-acyltransferase-like enzyme
MRKSEICLYIPLKRIKAGSYDWFSQLSYRSGKRWLFAAIVPATVFWIAIMLVGGALNDKLELYMGAMTWQSAAYALWESFVSVAMAIGLITLFRERYNYRTGTVKAMSDSSFTVYMFHAPIIIAISLALSHLQVSPVVKFFIALITGLPICFVVSHFVIRRIPLLKKVL